MGRNAFDVDRGIEQVVETKAVAARLPSEFLSVPGLIGKIAAYTNQTSHRVQPDLAFAGALSLMSVLTGRKICDEQDTRTNIYSFGLAPSGGGKDRARQVNKEVLKLAGGLHLIGQESFASQQGLFSQVETRGAVLCQVDELGEFMKSIKNPRASHLHGVIAELLKLYSSAHTVYLGPAHADSTKDKSVEQPHFVFYGTTVAESFFDAMTTESITGGFLARAFFFEGDSELQEKQKAVKSKIDPAIVDEVKSWLEFSPGGNLNNVVPVPKIVLTSVEAEKVYAEADRMADGIHNELKSPLGTIYTRLVENAKKLGLLYACSQWGPNVANVSGRAAQWAVDVALNRCQRMQFLAETRVSENEYDALRKKLIGILRDAGPEGLTATQWYRATRTIAPQKLKEAMTGLQATGDMVRAPGINTQNGRGRPSQTWILGNFWHLFPAEKAVNSDGQNAA